MNSLILILVAIVVFAIAYATYGKWLCKEWGVDVSRPTPAHTLEDGVDYVPTKAPILLGHHFSSIAGAGPIAGPIAAAVFGWLPVMLWIIIGGIFFGGTHDMGALFTSVRNDGHSIGEVIRVNMGEKGKKLFSWFAWLTLLLVVAAFTSITANTFAAVPSAGTSSCLFILLAIAFGGLVYRKGASLGISSVIGVVLLFFCIWFGMKFPLQLSATTWIVILLVYIAIASVTPVWILLQPRDYLNSFLLYAMLLGGIIGLLFKHPSLELAPVTGFDLGNSNYLFPMLFVTVACGAISGFHSLVSSGTTSKQIDNEKDIRVIGYGSMLIESVLATLAIITAAYISKDKFGELLAAGSQTNVFSNGLADFMSAFGIPFAVGKSFTALAISAFAMTSLDSSTRIARFIFQEMFEKKDAEGNHVETPLTNKYVATIITVVLGGFLTFKGWQTIWPIFGSANQLLAALALLSLAVYLKKHGKKYRMASIPTMFMFAVTLCALILVVKNNLGDLAHSWLLVLVAIVLFVLALILMKVGFGALKSNTELKED